MKNDDSFSKQIDDVLSGKYNRFDALKVCDTPRIFLDAGLQQLPILYTQNHLKDALHEKSADNPHWHGLSIEQIKKVPKLLESPVLLMDSLNNDDSIVAVLSLLDNDNAPVFATIKPNGNGIYNSHKTDSNFMLSIYGKEKGFEYYIKRAAEKNKILYWNKEKSQEIQCAELLMAQGLDSLDSNKILHQTNSLVNKTTSTLVIDSNQAARIKAAREIKENMPNLSENERAAAIAILEAGAKSQRMSISEYMEKTFPNGIFGDIKKAENSAKQQGIEINGAVSINGFGENAKAVIYASKTADFSTWCHELSHIWQSQLTGELKQNAEEAFQVKNSDWQNSIYTFEDGHADTSAEAFAYGFEDFLKHKAGEMATEDKKAIFEKFADYMSRTYNGVKQNIKINEKIAKVYEKFLQFDDNILAEAEKAVRLEIEQEQKINKIFNSPNLKTSQKVSEIKIPRVESFQTRSHSNSNNITDAKNVNISFQPVDSSMLFQSAYHGSSANFEKFNTSEYGMSGDGAMAFGYGVYVSNSETIARSYAGIQGERNLYSVEIPDGDYIVWDKKISNSQKEKVKNELYENLIKEDYKGVEKQISAELDNVFSEELDGKNLYGTVSSYIGSDKETSKFFKNIGYSGIQYPAGTPENAINYVIFDDNDITIKDHFQFQALEKKETSELNHEKQPKIETSNQLQEKPMENQNIEPSKTEFSNYDSQEYLQKQLATQMILDQEDKEQMEAISATMKSATKDFMDLNATPITEEKTMKSTENFESKEYWKNQFQYDNAEPFKAIDDYLEKGIRPKNNEFIFKNVPEVLKYSGISKNDIILTTGIINKAKNTHNLSDEEIKNAILSLSTPVAIFDSDKNKSENNTLSIINITDIEAENNKPIAITINLDNQRKGYEQKYLINEIRSIHDRTLIAKNGVNIVEEWAKAGLLRYVDDKKISNLVKEREDSFLLPLAKLDKNNINLSSKIVNSTAYQEIRTFSEFTEQQKAMEKEYQEYLGTISPDEKSSRRIDSDSVNLEENPSIKKSQGDSREKLNAATYKFQSNETLDEIIQSDSSFSTEAALLDNLIDCSIREVYEYATEKEQRVLRGFASFRNDYDTDMKNLAIQTDCAARWIAAKHWNPEKQEFQKEYVNRSAIESFPYELPWEMEEIEKEAAYNTAVLDENGNAHYQETEERIDFLKTPTGNKSELSENEWKFSHSSEFKELYGDWEGKIKKDFLLSDDTVSQLTGNEFGRKEGFTLTEQVEQYFNEMNNSVESPFFGKVVLDKDGADDSLSHGMGRLKAVAYAGVPDVIKKGVIIDSDSNHKDRGYNSYVIAAPIKIADKNYICEVVLKQNKQENRFYLHEVTEQKKFLERAFVTNSAQKPAHQGTLSNILEKTVSVNYEISCPMSINGEPEKIFVQNEYRKSLNKFQSKNQNTAIKNSDSVKQEENTSLQMEPGLIKKFNEMKKAIESREKQETQTAAEKTESAGSRKAENHEKLKVDLIKKAAKDFISAIKNGTAPFLNSTEKDFGKISLRPAAIVNASNGLPFSGEAQLLAQIYYQQQKMEGEIVTTFEGAKESGTFIANKPESKKNFVLANKTEQQQKEIIQKTRYFMPEACDEPDKIYAHALQKQRPQKISDYRDLIRHFENIPNGQKEISDLRIRIAHEHLKEIQSRFAMKKERILTVDEINERKKILQDYFKNLPEKHRESEKNAFENTFGLTLNPEEIFKTNLEGNFKNKKFEDVVKSNEKLTDQANRKLSSFIQKNSMEDKKLSEILHEEYNAQSKEEKETSKKLKIEAIGISEPETYLGKYIAACNANAEFVTDEDTIKAVQSNLVKKLEENYRVEKYGILKEIGQQAQRISNETTSKIAFDKAHSNKNTKEKKIEKEIGPIGMGN